MKQNHKKIEDNKIIELKQVDFDDYAKDYREIHTKNIQAFSGKDSSYFGEYKVRIICQEVECKKKVKILDLGCGDGLNAVFLKSISQGCDIMVWIFQKRVSIRQNRQCKKAMFLSVPTMEK